MRMKKWGALLLVLMLVTMAAACAGGDNAGNSDGVQGAPADGGNSNNVEIEDETLAPEPGAKLVVWQSGTERAIVDEAARDFKERYGIDVEYQEVGPDKTIERMITDGPAGVGADVFIAVHDRLGSAVQAGVILPNDIHADETIASNSAKAIEALTMDDILFGYPMSVETIAVYYNKDLIPEAPKTWGEVIDFARTFNNVNDKKYAYMWEMGNGYWNWGFLGGYDAYLFGDNGTNPDDIGLNTPGAVEAAKFYQSLKEILPLATADVLADIKTSLFESGKLAMNVSGPWQTQQFKDNVPNVGIMEFPTLPNGNPMKPFSGVKGWLVNANSKYPNAAKLFAEMISSEEYQLKNYKLFGALPSNLNAALDESIVNDPFSSVFLKQFDNSTPMPKISEMAAFWGTHEAAFSSLWNEQTDAQTAMDTWVKNIKDGIASSQ